MKAVLFFLFLIFLAFPASAELAKDRIYFFVYKNCAYCKVADKYMKKNYPKLEIDKIDIAGVDNTLLFLECAGKHGLDEMTGTPLICIGDHYIKGWGKDAPAQFDAYVKPLLKLRTQP